MCYLLSSINHVLFMHGSEIFEVLREVVPLLNKRPRAASSTTTFAKPLFPDCLIYYESLTLILSI